MYKFKLADELSLVKNFKKYLFKKMSECSHHLNTEDKNPYHLEGSVLNHTKLVLQQIKFFKKEIYNKRLYRMLVFAGLLHDTGKIFAREVRNGKVYFTGHEGISFYIAYDYLKSLKGISKLFSEHEIKIICLLVYYHSIFYHKNNLTANDFHTIGDVIKHISVSKYIEDVFLLEFYYLLVCLIISDVKGRITTNKSKRILGICYKILDIIKDSVNYNIIVVSRYVKHKGCKGCIVPIGVQCCGKSTIRNKYLQLGFKVICKDDIRVEYVQNRLNKDGLSYYDCWQYLDKNNLHKEIDKIAHNQLMQYKKNGYNLYIDEMNISKKSKRYLESVLRNYKIIYYLMFCEFRKIFFRNKQRTLNERKYIPECEIIKAMQRLWL